MKTYKCDRCSKIFKQKSHFLSHQKRINPCIQNVSKGDPKLFNEKEIVDTKTQINCIQQNIQTEKSNITCKYCNKCFTYKTNLYKHFKRCKVKMQIIEEKKNIYEQLLEKMKQQEESIKEIKEENQEIKEENQEIKKENKKLRTKIKHMKHKSINIHNNNSNICYYANNSNNNSIKLVAYGKEDKKKFDYQEILNAIQGFGTEVALTKLIHFNDKYPENHNVYINSMKDKYATTFDGEKWILKPKTDVVEDIYDTNRDIVEERMKDFVRSLDDSRMNALNRWLDTEENDAKILKIKEEIKLLLYNEKEKIINSNTSIKLID